jgi:formylglycine-generating enzyme
MPATCYNPRVWRTGTVVIALTACGRIGYDKVTTTSNDADATTDVDVLTGRTDAIDGPDAAATSCIDLASTCGPTATGNCCETLPVPGGTFARSYDFVDDGMYSDASYVATVSDFALDKYEVTVGRFRQFVATGTATQADPPAAGAGARPHIAGSGWDASWNTKLAVDRTALAESLACSATFQTWTDTPGANESRPINCVTWYEAVAFCAWDRGFLPTEAEWNYAAAGGAEQRAYPWSNPPETLDIDETRASYYSTDCLGDGVPGCAVTDLVPVGSKPAGDARWGHSDLGGNVFEATLDAFVTPYALNPCTDCADLAASDERAMRGGHFFNTDGRLRVGYRFRMYVDNRSYLVGFRCAR